MIENNFQGKKGQVIPNMNEEFINLVSNRYIELFEKITDQDFERGDVSNLLNRVEDNIMKVIISKIIFSSIIIMYFTNCYF